MIEETGTLVSIDGPYAEVQAQRQAACGGCAARGGCGTALLEQVFSRRPVRVRALNEAGAGIGERVVIGIPEQGLLSAAAAVYLVPILSLVAGAIAVQGVVDHLLGGRGGDLGAVVGAVGGFVLALRWLSRYSGRFAARSRAYPVVIRRVGEGAGVFVQPPGG